MFKRKKIYYGHVVGSMGDRIKKHLRKQEKEKVRAEIVSKHKQLDEQYYSIFK
jgi:hypothetical protein